METNYLFWPYFVCWYDECSSSLSIYLAPWLSWLLFDGNLSSLAQGAITKKSLEWKKSDWWCFLYSLSMPIVVVFCTNYLTSGQKGTSKRKHHASTIDNQILGSMGFISRENLSYAEISNGSNFYLKFAQAGGGNRTRDFLRLCLFSVSEDTLDTSATAPPHLKFIF